ncbi:MAG: pseudouridine synthase [Myxococcales bacterium]|nr:rRNA pseudouridine synthase [Myxococcota bacterium]MDW8280219.1 pseudouridine synthase [Myxococcales bacterium]
MQSMRLQVWLARSGVASRRRAEGLITAGHVRVNGQVVRTLGTKIDPVHDRITVDGRPVRPQEPVYVLLNKPKGYVTTAHDPDGRPTIFALLPDLGVRLYPVGRLDYNTEGALLLTNDGMLAHGLMHPSRGVPKVYHVKLQGHINSLQLQRLREGVELPPPTSGPRRRRGAPSQPERSAPAKVEIIGDTGRHSWLRIELHEGKNRQIHRMAAAIGSSVRKLIRVAYAGLTLEGLNSGAYRRLSADEVRKLRQMAGLCTDDLQQPTPSGQRTRSKPGARTGATQSHRRRRRTN